MIKPNTRAEDNVKKYLIPPTWEEMDSFIKEVGISIYHFELYYGISFNHLAKVRCGQKKLARCYWHIFYERIIPQFGVGITGNYPNKSVTKNLTKTIPKRIPNHNGVANKKALVALEPDTSHDRLVTVK